MSFGRLRAIGWWWRATIRAKPNETAKILEVHGEDGGPPFVVRWEDGTTTTLYPSSDVKVQHFPKES